MCSPTSETRGSASGRIPCTSVPLTRPSRDNMVSPRTKGAVPITLGCRLTSSVAWRQSSRRPSTPLTLAWEAMPRMRVRNSSSKPFITDSTVISAVTPRAMPSMEVSEMKEMKWLRRLARV